MKGWRFTKVWQVDHRLVVADTVCEAINLYKAYMGKDYTDEPHSIRAISTDSALLPNYCALISEEK